MPALAHDLGRQHLDLDPREVLGQRPAAARAPPAGRRAIDLGVVGVFFLGVVELDLFLDLLDDDVAAGEHHLEDLQRELGDVAGGEALGLLADDEQVHVELLVPLALGGQLVDRVRVLADAALKFMADELDGGHVSYVRFRDPL
nr:hypothetical protein [Nannocystis exedens]